MARNLPKKIRAAIEAEVKALISRNGTLTPNRVLEAAKDKRTALHKYFEWDDKKAGHAYRLEQARQLIRSVECEVTVYDRGVRCVALVRTPNVPASRQSYSSVERLRENRADARAALEYEMDRAESYLNRCLVLAEVFKLKPEFERLVSSLQELRGRL